MERSIVNSIFTFETELQKMLLEILYEKQWIVLEYMGLISSCWNLFINSFIYFSISTAAHLNQ